MLPGFLLIQLKSIFARKFSEFVFRAKQGLTGIAAI